MIDMIVTTVNKMTVVITDWTDNTLNLLKGLQHTIHCIILDEFQEGHIDYKQKYKTLKKKLRLLVYVSILWTVLRSILNYHISLKSSLGQKLTLTSSAAVLKASDWDQYVEYLTVLFMFPSWTTNQHTLRQKPYQQQ